jgi:hypothetical protein
MALSIVAEGGVLVAVCGDQVRPGGEASF